MSFAVEEARAARPLPAVVEGERAARGSTEGGDDVEAVEDEVQAEIAAVARSEGDATVIPGAPTVSIDEDGPVWPDEAAESAMRAEIGARGETLNSKAAREAAEAAAEEAAEKRGLPKLDDLVEQIPPDVRETLEDLFRAKFVKVARVPKKALKAETAKK